jgi:alkylation response protein AidB-like acyl-CoA dehydrogenase
VDGHHEPDRAAGGLGSCGAARRAERAGDGTYRIFGQKIFITYGEHDFTDNIVHLVLARLPDAPAGTRGISLFLVPKFLVNADGSLGKPQRRVLPPRSSTSSASTARRPAP